MGVGAAEEAEVAELAVLPETTITVVTVVVVARPCAVELTVCITLTCARCVMCYTAGQ